MVEVTLRSSGETDEVPIAEAGEYVDNLLVRSIRLAYHRIDAFLDNDLFLDIAMSDLRTKACGRQFSWSTSSAITTERWRPPVQPTAMVK